MSTAMRVIAKANGYEVIENLNGIVEIHHGPAIYICDGMGAYELIRKEVKDPETRTELLRQWFDDKVAQAHAESNSREAEYRG